MRNAYEMKRYERIAIASVYDFHSKDNRNTQSDLTEQEQALLDQLCAAISSRSLDAKAKLQALMTRIQKRIIKDI